MEKNEYLSEERYQKNNAKVKNIGKILLIVGIILLVISSILIVVGFMGFGSTVLLVALIFLIILVMVMK